MNLGRVVRNTQLRHLHRVSSRLAKQVYLATGVLLLLTFVPKLTVHL